MVYDFEASLLVKLKTVLPKNERKVIIRNVIEVQEQINASEV